MASNAGKPAAFGELLAIIVENFADAKSTRQDFDCIYPGKDIDDQEYIGAGLALPVLYQAGVEGFIQKVLNDQGSPYYRLRAISSQITKYMNYFDDRPDGPDLMKYFLGFGLCLDHYLKSGADRPIVRMLARMRTVRMLHVIAAMSRPDGLEPPSVMTRKLLRIWQELDNDTALMGKYGTYLVYKTWSLGGAVADGRSR